MSGRFTQFTIRVLDSAARLLPKRKAEAEAEHLSTGRRGEEEAYFYLRRHGYVIVARNYRSPRTRSELDMAGWDQDTLCFIEVKTRTSREVMPAEAAVDHEKRHDLSQVAREFLRKMPVGVAFRFDIVSVYFTSDGQPEIELFKNAFPFE